VSGGYGSGGYPGRGAPDYDDDPERARPRRPGGSRAGYQGPGYGAQDYADPRRQQGGYQQGGYDDPRDDSFLPGFGGGGGYGGGPRQGYDDRPGYDDRQGYDGQYGYDNQYGYDDRRGPRGGGPGQRRDDWGDQNVRPRKKATRWLPRILVLAVVGVIVIGGLVGGLSVYHKYEARYHPADYAGPGTGEVTVQVKSGDTAFSLAPRLLSAGVIASTRAFTNAAENSTTTTASSNGLEAGFYQLHQHMQASLAYAALLNPKNLVQTVVTIPEGKRAVDVIAIIAKNTKIPLKDFQQVLAHPAQLGLPSYANGKAEGYLFPATYAIVPHETALQILQAMVKRFNDEATAINLESAAKSAGLTASQLITEASLAQAEGGSVSDYPKIAEVIHNRLAIGMHLQFDSTVLYGIGQYRVSATIKETKTPGPYNTYLNAGLPPGPISNPGDAAIKGILNADHGNWLYFLTVPNGKSQFSATPLKGQ
jgi:peptidoglycan lytic transglycosylase G